MVNVAAAGVVAWDGGALVAAGGTFAFDDEAVTVACVWPLPVEELPHAARASDAIAKPPRATVTRLAVDGRAELRDHMSRSPVRLS